MTTPKLIYFASRGRAEVIRLVAAEAGVEYQNETFAGPEAFTALKSSGRLPFLAVPVWEEDGFRLAQSQAIANHLARAHGMRGRDAKEEARVDEALGAVEDVRTELRRLAQAEVAKRPEVRADLTGNVLPRWFGLLEKHLGSNEFIAGGGSITVADLALWYLIELARDNGFATALADAPKLDGFFKRIAARKKLDAYLTGPGRFPLQKLPG